MRPEHLMATFAVLAFLTILYWVRKREMREKYAVVWIGVSLGILVLGVFPQILTTIRQLAQISFATAILLVTLGPMVFFAFSVSVSLSRAYKKATRHTQEIALLEKRIRDLEQALDHQSNERGETDE